MTRATVQGMRHRRTPIATVMTDAGVRLLCCGAWPLRHRSGRSSRGFSVSSRRLPFGGHRRSPQKARPEMRSSTRVLCASTLFARHAARFTEAHPGKAGQAVKRQRHRRQLAGSNVGNNMFHGPAIYYATRRGLPLNFLQSVPVRPKTLSRHCRSPLAEGKCLHPIEPKDRRDVGGSGATWPGTRGPGGSFGAGFGGQSPNGD